MRTALDDADVFHHQNLVRIHHGGQAVGDVVFNLDSSVDRLVSSTSSYGH